MLGFADSLRMQTRGFQVHEVVNIGKEMKMLYMGLATTEETVIKGQIWSVVSSAPRSRDASSSNAIKLKPSP